MVCLTVALAFRYGEQIHAEIRAVHDIGCHHKRTQRQQGIEGEEGEHQDSL
jgi:hypothetical protein